MNSCGIVLPPLLAAALLVSACVGEPEAVTQTVRVTEDDSGLPPFGDRIFFDFDSAALRPDAIDTIDRQAEWLKTESGVMALIEGHTDNRGPEKYNLELACRRATAMREALIERGIAAERLETIGYGEYRPYVLGDNETAWAQNRRALLFVLSGDHDLGVGGSYCDDR